MPLVHSKTDAAFVKNLKAEKAAGKPTKQALAIAYSVKRRAQAKGKLKKRCKCGGTCGACRG